MRRNYILLFYLPGSFGKRVCMTVPVRCSTNGMRCTLCYVLIEIALAKFAAKVKFVTFCFHNYNLDVLF